MAARILVIRGGAIGDFILTLPAIKLLRDHFPEAEIEILGYRHIVSIAEGRFYANRTRCIEYAPMAGFFVPNSELAPDLVEYFAGFQQVISYLYDPDRFFENNVRRCGVKNYIAGPGKLHGAEHAARQLARPLESLALFLEERSATVFPNENDREFAAGFFGGISGPVLALHPGSGGAGKNWPLVKWLELGAKRWAADPGLTILLVGGEADRRQLEALEHGWRDRPLLVGKDLPLPHLAAILARCTAFAGHDSGISHLAAAVGTPSLVLFGPTDPEVWGPANKQVRIVRAPGGSLEDLEVETVDSALMSLL